MSTRSSIILGIRRFDRITSPKLDFGKTGNFANCYSVPPAPPPAPPPGPFPSATQET